MAFMGIFLIWSVVIFFIIGLCTLLGVLLLILSFSSKKKYIKRLEAGEQPSRTYIVLRVFAVAFFLPVASFLVLLIVQTAKNGIENKQSLGYAVMQGHYKQAEKLLQSGVSPDCTYDDNEPAKDGEETLLFTLAGRGFVDNFGDEKSDSDTDDELKMMNLLIKYGANLEYRPYKHEEQNSQHSYQEESDYYLPDDMCGCTPLLTAVYYGQFDKVKLLVESGADVSATDYCGFNAIAIIADNLSDEHGVPILNYLIEQGCSKYCITNFGQDTFFLAYRNTNNEQIREILIKRDAISKSFPEQCAVKYNTGFYAFGCKT